MSVRSCVCLLFALTFMPFSKLAASSAGRPNVLVILSDDQGWGDVSLNGNPNFRTPNIDRLAREGARFDRFYVAPVCAPTRAEFLTGRHAGRGGVRGVDEGEERLDLGERTLADVFRAAGYATGAFGKWHNGGQYPYHPNGRGFDEYYGFCSGHWGDYFDADLLNHNGKPVRGEGYLPDEFTDRAIAFMRARSAEGRPWLCYVPFNTPHTPLQAPARFVEAVAGRDLPARVPDEDVAFTRAVIAMVENIDWNVGRLLAHLEASGELDRTIVLYFSDNGPNSQRWNGGMRGKKGSTDEGGVRSPLVMRFPPCIRPNTTVRPIAAAIDLLPTLAELCDVALHADPARPLDGRSLVPLFAGEHDVWPDARVLVQSWAGKTSARDQRHRLDDAGRLYDMLEDPGQTRDIAAAHPRVAARLRAEVERYNRESLPRGPDTRPYVVGHPDAPVTLLPADDARFTAGIRRSNRWPNCSYLTGWTDPADVIRWPVDLAAGGRFAVDVHYTCARENVGAEIEFSFGAKRVSAVVSEAHDPPARGADHDLVPRKESPVKTFRPLRLGVVELPAGSGDFTLRALARPGPGLVEVRLLEITRLSP